MTTKKEAAQAAHAAQFENHAEFVDDEALDRYVQALRDEKAALEARGNGRAKDVDAELARVEGKRQTREA